MHSMVIPRSLASKEIVSFPGPFPDKVRERILDQLDRSDLLEYSLASRLFNAESNRIVWRKRTFWFEPHARDFVQACAPILRDPQRALCLKEFSIMMHRTSDMYHPIPWPAHIFETWAATLSLLRNVTLLNIGESSSSLVAPLRTLHDYSLTNFLRCIERFVQATPLQTLFVRLDLVRAGPLLLICPALQRLRLHTTWQDDNVTVPVPWNALPNLRDLEVDVSHVLMLAPDRPHLEKLAISLVSTDRELGDILRRCRVLRTFRVLQPPCHTSHMGPRLRGLGRMPTIQHLEYGFYEPDEGDCMARGTIINGTNVRDVLEPVRNVFVSLQSCVLDVPAHPEDVTFPALLRDGPMVLYQLQADGDFPYLRKFTWNMGPGLDPYQGERIMRFQRSGGVWSGTASWFTL